MKQKAVEIKKIPLEDFINLLIEIHHEGARFVDIIAQPDSKQDTMTVIVKEEYLIEGQDMIESQKKDLPATSEFDPDELISLS